MAKLSAFGRTEVIRFAKEQWALNRESHERIDWCKVTYALMSDNFLLMKREVRFVKTDFHETYKHSYGWVSKGKTGFSAEKLKEVLLAQGYQVVEKKK